MNKMKEKEQIAKQSDEECKFKESSKLWNELQQEDVSFLEKRLFLSIFMYICAVENHVTN